MNEIDSGAATSMTTGEQEKLISSATSSHSPFENIEKQQDDGDESVLDPDDDDEDSWGFLVLEAILYIPMLVRSLFASMNFARSFVLGEAVMLFLEKRPWWLQRCQSVFSKIDSNVCPPPSFLLLVALTVIALVVHPDGFTWVILGKTRKGALSLAEITSMWWDIFINEHGAILSSILALATFAALFFLAYVLQKTLSPQKQCESSDKKNAKLPTKKKKRKGGCSRPNYRLGKNTNKSSLELHDRADGSSKGEETSTGSSSSTIQHQPLQTLQETTDDKLPIYSSSQSTTAEAPENATHLPSAADVSVLRERSFSGSTTTTESGETSNSRAAYQPSDGTSLSTIEGGSMAYSVTTHTNNPQSLRKKNTRPRNTRRLSHPKPTHDALSNSPARVGSQCDSLKAQGATFNRTVERHDKQASKSGASRAFSTTKTRNNPSRTFAVNRPQNDEIKSSQRIIPPREHDRWNTASSEYPSMSSHAPHIVSPAFHYHDAGDYFSHFNNNQACSTKQRPTAKPMDETWPRTSNNLTQIPAPPGLSHPTGFPPSAATVGIPLPAGSFLPMSAPSHSYPLRETDLHDIAMSRVKENPFESSANVLDQTEEDRIDAELQELGGRMVGSILDF